MSERHSPIPLHKPGGLSHEWFDREPRHSLPPSGSIPPPPIVLASPFRTAFAGVLVGAVGGGVALAVARLIAHRDLADGIASALTHDLHGVPKAAWAFGAAAAVGAVIALLVALVTRHVRRALPIAIFGAVFAPVAWLGMHVLALRHHAWLVTEVLPVGPMIVGAAVFGVLLALIVPVRGH